MIQCLPVESNITHTYRSDVSRPHLLLQKDGLPPNDTIFFLYHVRVCVRMSMCARTCVCACARVCVRTCVCGVEVHPYMKYVCTHWYKKKPLFPNTGAYAK